MAKLVGDVSEVTKPGQQSSRAPCGVVDPAFPPRDENASRGGERVWRDGKGSSERASKGQRPKTHLASGCKYQRSVSSCEGVDDESKR
jgi:hypothetical protein